MCNHVGVLTWIRRSLLRRVRGENKGPIGDALKPRKRTCIC
uniref:Uncharacterized protein n=1 Tax=Arundo donax TaxID=35708 RepID=A0A0A9FK36_ARUDO